ncbi:MAG: class I SAM-dependent methyltransferase [Thermodesulfobacteriota bacterium]
MERHVIACEDALRAWGGRRSGDLKGNVLPSQNIMPILARNEALFRCLHYMESVLNVDFSQYNVLDVGSASGYGLVPFLTTGFSMSQLHGIDLFEDRINLGREKYPGLSLVLGDATRMDEFEPGQFDMVMEQFCFCHIESDETRAMIAREMLRVVKPGGYILVLDWVVGNTKWHYNGVPKSKRLSLFPGAEIIRTYPAMLAPPIGRILSRYAPWGYLIVRAVMPWLALAKLTLMKAA